MEVKSSSQKIQSQMIDSDGPYRLLYCSSKGDKDGVIQEIRKGVSPNLADYNKRTALHLASCEGFTEIVVLLLGYGADVNSTDCWGHTSLEISDSYANTANGILHIEDSNVTLDLQPLEDARSFGHEEICKILKTKGGINLVGLDSPCYEIDYIEVDLENKTLIEEGTYGEVYLVRWRGTEVAAKTIRSCLASNSRVKSIFMKEIALWQRLRHPNIVQYLGLMKHPDRLIVLTEYLRNGSLYDILRKKGKLDPHTAVAYGLDIARGMNYLHQRKPHAIIHRDLTPRNILLDEAGHLKVTNFGLSTILQEEYAYSPYKMTGGTGSYRYMAPEVYRRESYGKSVDVFSFALILHEMFQGKPANQAEAPEAVADRRAYEDARPSLTSHVFPKAIKILLGDCWHKNPEFRPSFEHIIVQLEHIQENLASKKAKRVFHGCLF